MSTSSPAPSVQEPDSEASPDDLPLSLNQQGLWYIDHLDSETAAYNIVFSSRIVSTVDVDALRRALQRVTDRHEALRTVFPERDGTPRQRILPTGEVAFRHVDASGWSEETLRAQAKEEAAAPIDLADGPVMRTALFSTASDDHVFVLTVHHIAVDFWGLGLVLDELRSLYAIEVGAREDDLDAVERQYRDFTAWQAEMLDGEEGAEARAYWHEALDGAGEPLNLNTDHPRPPVQTYRGDTVPFRLDRDFTEAIKTASKEANVTPFMTMLSVLQLLLHRYSRQDDVCVGSPFFGRNRADHDVVGNFVNTVVLRADFEEATTFRDVLDQARDSVRGALRNQNYPFARLVETLVPDRDPSRPPLYQVAFNWERLPQFQDLSALFALGTESEPLPFGELKMTPYGLPQQEGQVDLTLEMGGEVDGRYHGALKYNTDLFDADTAERMVGHLKRLLRAAVSDPDAPIDALPILTDEEETLLFDTWNDTARDATPERCLHELVERQAAATPDARALRFEGETLTYDELNDRANQLARLLEGCNVGPGQFVALFLDRSPQMFVSLLAVLKTGAAYVPLDPAYPAERIKYVVENADVEVIVTESALADALPETDASILKLDAQADSLLQQRADNLVNRVTPDDLAYVIYTSGSTGRPKGVKIPHRAVVNFLTSMQRKPGIEASDVLLAVTTLSFDIAVLELFLPLTVGAEVAIVSSDVAADAHRLAEAIDASGATVMQATPATWQMLVESGWDGVDDLTVLSGGEALPRALADRLLERVDALYNMYGPTETTIWSSVRKVDPDADTVSIGRPIDNTTFYVLDEAESPVPVGVPGELHIGGQGLADGYLGKPDLTDAVFVEDPFAADPEARMYKTGDLVSYRADGTLAFHGRIDNQVKVRGFRIELGEIESVLREHEAVDQAVVVAREDGPAGQQLVAYVVPSGDAESLDGALRTHLKKHVPGYMVPPVYVTLDALPLTPNGKVDRNALPAPDRRRSGDEYVAPRSALEVQLVQLWEEVLERSPVGVTDDFFDMGGHSLLGVRMMSKLREQTGHDFEVSVLFQAPTIEEFAEVIQGGGTGSRILVPLRPTGTHAPLFCPHPIGGTVFTYVPMVRHLEADRPVYGLQSPGLSDAAASDVSVEAIAARYVDEIREVQPEGPYHIAGWCFGGLIGYEMAQQLKAQGEEIAYLAMLDSAFPSEDEEEEAFDDATLLSWFARDLAVPVGKELDLPDDELRAMDQPKMLPYVLREAKAIEVLPESTEVDEIQRYFHVYLANGIALQNYRPVGYEGDAVYVRALDAERDYSDRWRNAGTPPITIRDAPGTHNTMMYEPNVEVVADVLNDGLLPLESSSASAVDVASSGDGAAPQQTDEPVETTPSAAAETV